MTHPSPDWIRRCNKIISQSLDNEIRKLFPIDSEDCDRVPRHRIVMMENLLRSEFGLKDCIVSSPSVT